MIWFNGSLEDAVRSASCMSTLHPSPSLRAFFLPSMPPVCVPLEILPFARAPRSCLLSLRALRVEAFLPLLELGPPDGLVLLPCFRCLGQGPPFGRASSCPFGFCLLCLRHPVGFSPVSGVLSGLPPSDFCIVPVLLPMIGMSSATSSLQLVHRVYLGCCWSPRGLSV